VTAGNGIMNMNWTLTGKILVAANLALSVGLATLGIGIYTNHIDWPGSAAGSGEFGRRKAEVDEAGATANVLTIRYDDTLTRLAGLEGRQPTDEEYYAKQLAILEGKDKTGKQVADPVSLLALQPGSDDKKAEDAFQPKPAAKPLLSRRSAQEELARMESEIRKEIDRVKAAVDEEKRLTTEINGVAGTQKGVRDLLAEENAARKNNLQELEFLRPLRYNRQVEAEILQRRQNALRTRLGEAQALGMAVR
jgi:hypothetical protein